VRLSVDSSYRDPNTNYQVAVASNVNLMITDTAPGHAVKHVNADFDPDFSETDIHHARRSEFYPHRTSAAIPVPNFFRKENEGVEKACEQLCKFVNVPSGRGKIHIVFVSVFELIQANAGIFDKFGGNVHNDSTNLLASLDDLFTGLLPIVKKKTLSIVLVFDEVDTDMWVDGMEGEVQREDYISLLVGLADGCKKPDSNLRFVERVICEGRQPPKGKTYMPIVVNIPVLLYSLEANTKQGDYFNQCVTVNGDSIVTLGDTLVRTPEHQFIHTMFAPGLFDIYEAGPGPGELITWSAPDLKQVCVQLLLGY